MIEVAGVLKMEVGCTVEVIKAYDALLSSHPRVGERGVVTKCSSDLCRVMFEGRPEGRNDTTWAFRSPEEHLRVVKGAADIGLREGSRVRCTKGHDGNDSIIGKTGEVSAYEEGSTYALVWFDEGQDVRGHGRNGLEWSVPVSILEVIG